MSEDEKLQSLAVAEQYAEEEWARRQWEVMPEIEAYENAQWLWRLWRLGSGL